MRRLLLVFCAVSLLASCASLFDNGGRRQGSSSSLVDFLYPKGEVPPQPDGTVPHLALPLHVGLAFVPSRDATTPGLSEAHKNALLGKVKEGFTGRPFIREITVVPDTYLRARGGFDSLDQVARLYGFDVIALVSYDQVVHTEETKASFLYWTLVGAYFIKGSQNDVQTFVDAAVIDVRTRKLLLRAPGIDRIDGTSTLVNRAEELRAAREKSFDNALENMTHNLATEVDAFRERIKTDRSVTVSQANGPAHASGGGGGALGIVPVALLGVLGMALKRTRRRNGAASRQPG
jgi:rhombotail lipoprotein